MSVSAVATVFSVVPVPPGVVVTLPTVKPAAVMVVLAAELATPSSYSWLSLFSFTTLTFNEFCCHYAAKSPSATQVSVALLTSVADDH